MILGPYFALAGIIAKNKSVWVEVNRMLHTHISMPILGGLALFYGSFWGYAFVFFVLPRLCHVHFLGHFDNCDGVKDRERLDRYSCRRSGLYSAFSLTSMKRGSSVLWKNRVSQVSPGFRKNSSETTVSGRLP